MTVLRTARLVLRPPVVSDADAVVAMFADPELSRFLEVDLTDAEAARAVAHRAAADTTGRWVFERDGTVVGTGRLRPSTELPGGVLEIGYYVGRPHWGLGIAGEAVGAMLRHAFATLAAPAVFALVHEHNGASRAVVAGRGFVRVGSGMHYEALHDVFVAFPTTAGHLHHVELWVPDLAEARRSWGWLLTELGYTEYQRWDHGVSWRLGATYLVFEDSPARSGDRHERLRPGLNHLALHAGSRDRVDELVGAAGERGWRLMFADRHPYAGGPDHYAAYLENSAGFEVELVADSTGSPASTQS
jgi:RimJ/RimL family protein N-acetyltransferase